MNEAVVEGKGDQLFEIVGGSVESDICVLSLRGVVDGKRMMAVGKSLDEAIAAEPVETFRALEELMSLSGLMVRELKMRTWMKHLKAVG